MKKFILIFSLLISIVYASQTDLYFANGVLTSPQVAQDNLDLLEFNLRNEKKQIHEFYKAYNHTQNWFDFVESFFQKVDAYKRNEEFAQRIGAKMRETMHNSDLSTQKSSYKNSIANGYKVIAVAHSQGNLFTIEAYDEFTDKEKKDFFAISVASPAHRYITEDKEEKNPFISWDNDLVAHIGLYGTALTENPVRKIYWDEYGENTYPKPPHNYIYKRDLGKIYKHSWVSKEYFIEPFGWSINVHSFSFYMGKPLSEGKNFFEDPYGSLGTTLVTNTARDFIVGHIKAQLDKNSADNGDDDNNGDDSGGDNSGGDPSSFDYTSVCSSVDFPDPIPNELSETINGILQSNKDNLIADIVCPLIDTAVQAYNLQNTGGLPGGGDFP